MSQAEASRLTRGYKAVFRKDQRRLRGGRGRRGRRSRAPAGRTGGSRARMSQTTRGLGSGLAPEAATQSRPALVVPALLFSPPRALTHHRQQEPDRRSGNSNPSASRPLTTGSSSTTLTPSRGPSVWVLLDGEPIAGPGGAAGRALPALPGSWAPPRGRCTTVVSATPVRLGTLRPR